MKVRTLCLALIAVLVLGGCSLLEDDDEPRAAGTPLTQEELAGALLTIDDMPSGFAVDTSPDDEDRGVCGQPPASTVVPSIAQARVSFTRGALGPYVQQVTASFEESKAIEYMARLRESASCSSYSDPEVEGITSRIAEMSFPKLGDDTLALRIGNDQGFNADIVFLRIDDTVTLVGVGGLVAVDSALTEDLARKAEAKVKESLG